MMPGPHAMRASLSGNSRLKMLQKPAVLIHNADQNPRNAACAEFSRNHPSACMLRRFYGANGAERQAVSRRPDRREKRGAYRRSDRPIARGGGGGYPIYMPPRVGTRAMIRATWCMAISVA